MRKRIFAVEVPNDRYQLFCVLEFQDVEVNMLLIIFGPVSYWIVSPQQLHFTVSSSLASTEPRTEVSSGNLRSPGVDLQKYVEMEASV